MLFHSSFLTLDVFWWCGSKGSLENPHWAAGREHSCLLHFKLFNRTIPRLLPIVASKAIHCQCLFFTFHASWHDSWSLRLTHAEARLEEWKSDTRSCQNAILLCCLLYSNTVLLPRGLLQWHGQYLINSLTASPTVPVYWAIHATPQYAIWWKQQKRPTNHMWWCRCIC